MTLPELNALIDQVVNPQGGEPKVKGSALNALLRDLAAEIEAGSGSASDLAALSAALDAQKTRLDNLVANAPQALDTLKELATQLAADEQGAVAILATQQQHTQQLTNVVHLTDDEVITGQKTLTSQLRVSDAPGKDVLYFKGGPGNAGSQAGIAFDTTGLAFGANVSARYLFEDDGAYGAHHVWETKKNIAGDLTTVERMRLLTNGNLGVGTTSPSERLEVAGNVKAVKFIGDGSQLTGLTAPDVNKAYVDAADMALGTRIEATSTAIAAQLQAKAIRVVKATRERIPYTGVGTQADPRLDGIRQAVIAATAGDTVEQLTFISPLNKDEQLSLPKGVNYVSNGFPLNGNGINDSVTLLGGKGVIYGRNSVASHNLPYSWGIGMYNDNVDTDYVLYDLHIVSSYRGSGRKASSSVVYNVGNLVHYGNIDAITESAAVLIGSIGFPYQPGQQANYTHYGYLRIDMQTIGLRAENVGRILHVGDLTVKDTASTAGLALNNGQIEMRNGDLDLTTASAQGGFMVGPTGRVTLTNVRVVGGKLPAFPTTSSQGAGATLVLRGTTSGFDTKLIDPLITVIDEREIAATASSYTPQPIKNALVGATASDSWSNGELIGTQPTGSRPGMKCTGPTYRYEYMNGASDIDGTTYVWCRTLKA